MIQLDETAAVLEAVLLYCYPGPVDDPRMVYPWKSDWEIINALDKYFVRSFSSSGEVMTWHASSKLWPALEIA